MPAKKALWTSATALQKARKAAQSTEETLPSQLTANCQGTTLQQGHVGCMHCNVLISIKLSLLWLLDKTQRHSYSLVFMGLWPYGGTIMHKRQSQEGSKYLFSRDFLK